MRIIVHDYSGHPFQVQLSRELAARGHHVWHLFSKDFQTPKGRLSRGPNDPTKFEILGLTIEEPFQKDSFVRRRQQEVQFGNVAGEQIRRLSPDVVISSNAPLDTQRQIQAASRAVGAGFVFWIQDIYSDAILKVLRRKLGPVGLVVGWWYKRLEYRMLRQSNVVVAISEDFVPILMEGGVRAEKIVTVENWAPLDEVPAAPKDNDWSKRHGLAKKAMFIYSGTLGYKHNPESLLSVARHIPEAAVVVISEGKIADELKQRAAAERVRNIQVLPWVPFEELPLALASADVLIAAIEPEAGVFSVPSKVLTYMSAGRPILASIPHVNLAARIIKRQQCGLVSEPGDVSAFLHNAQRLHENPDLCISLGRSGRRYAETAFDIAALGARFEKICETAFMEAKGSKPAS